MEWRAFAQPHKSRACTRQIWDPTNKVCISYEVPRKVERDRAYFTVCNGRERVRLKGPSPTALRDPCPHFPPNAASHRRWVQTSSPKSLYLHMPRLCFCPYRDTLRHGLGRPSWPHSDFPATRQKYLLYQLRPEALQQWMQFFESAILLMLTCASSLGMHFQRSKGEAACSCPVTRSKIPSWLIRDLERKLGEVSGLSASGLQKQQLSK